MFQDLNDSRLASQVDGSLSSTPLRSRNGLSFVSGLTTEPLLTETVADFLANTVCRYGDRTAAVFCDENVRWTWSQLSDQVSQVAKGLLALGIEKGDRIGIWAPNCPEWLLTQFAAASVGAILVNLNPANRIDEMRYAINHVGMKTLIFAENSGRANLVGVVDQLLAKREESEFGKLQVSLAPSLSSAFCISDRKFNGISRFSDLIQMGSGVSTEILEQRQSELSFKDPIDIQFTSGTTGRPKAATLTHHNITNNAKFVAMAMNLTEQDRLCIPVPLFHCFGMVMSVLACVHSGSCMVFPSRSFNEEKVLESIENERCTALHGVPRMFISQLNHPNFEKYDLSSLRTGIMAGAPCPIEVMKRVVSEMHIPEITIAYGMTETSPVSFQSSVHDSIERRVSTVGRVAPHVEVKIVDEKGEIVAIDQPGELCTRGYSVMSGYWGEAAKTQEAIQDGWMRTGDIATIDKDGYCNIVGRIKDMIISGGEKYFPREIEELLLTHPKIVDVQVVGVPSDLSGESICACIITKPGESINRKEIKEYFKDRIDPHKIPRFVELVDRFPETLSGKPIKGELRRIMSERLGLNESRTA